VDGGSFLDENTVTYMDSAYRVLLVVTPNLASLRDARQFLDICRTLSYPAEKELLILNQTGRKTDIKLQEIEKVLHAQVIGRIPADDIIALSSMNEGVPIILKKPKHPISKEITKIAQELVKMLAAVGPLAQAEDEKAQEDMLKKTSRLG
jgi:pilus assembly protein CpaE